MCLNVVYYHEIGLMLTAVCKLTEMPFSLKNGSSVNLLPFNIKTDIVENRPECPMYQLSVDFFSSADERGVLCSCSQRE